MLEHKENFELENEYEQIWDSIRYKKVDELYDFTEKIIKLLDNHIDDKLLFHSDYDKIQHLFKKMKQKNFFYMSGSAKDIIKSANPKFESVYEYKKCVRDLKYIGSGDRGFENDKIYQSTCFNGATYKVNVDGNERIMGSSYFERVS
ncbi:MAG: hypothetical protein U9Q33_04740 [Campylobacterota bacterium]|nr:hypothetical protein [Campylobacterota bacterium]